MVTLFAMLLAASTPAPKSVEIDEGKDHYFGADAQTSASYLQLRADGRYVVVDVQHMGTDVDDSGTWHVEGRNILLESDYSVRNIDLGEFQVHIFDRCGQETLPELREKVGNLRKRGKPIVPNEYGDILDVTRIGHPLGRGEEKFCGSSLSYLPDDYPAKPVPAQRLDAVLNAIDAWLAQAATQHIFEYQAWEYGGERFLVAMRPGMQAVQQSVGEVSELMDRYDGQRASYSYYRISAEDYSARANCTYAFKFHPQMDSPCNDEMP